MTYDADMPTQPYIPSPDCIVRPAKIEELETLVRYQIEMARETEDLHLDPATVTRGVRAVFDDPRKGEYFVVTDDKAEDGSVNDAEDNAENSRDAENNVKNNSVLGMLLTVPEWSDWRNGTVLWIESVYVVPEARGRGLYRRLYHFLVERVQRSPDLHGLRLYVDRRNRSAQKVYEALGMTREHYELYEWLK